MTISEHPPRCEFRHTASVITRVTLGFGVIAVFFGVGVHQAQAAIGPENVIVVVNSDSRDSKTLANHYLSLRKIPPTNVVVLNDVPDGERVSLADFKTRILRPMLAEIDARKLTAQVKVIAYSAGFPTGVNIGEHTKRLTDPTQKKYQTAVASVNSLTFFYRFVLNDSPAYLDWMSNWYARKEFKFYFENVMIGETREKLKLADQHFKDKRWSDAIPLYDDLTAKYPGFASLSIRRCQCAVGAGRTEEAIGWVSRAVESGWRSGRFIAEDELLSQLMDEELVAKTVERLQQAPPTYQWATGFSALKGWTPNGEQATAKQGGMPYLLSCMLGVVGKHGSTIDQAVGVLQNAASVGLVPVKGTHWGFAKTGDVRTKTRFPGIVDSMLALDSLGAKGEIFSSTLPTSDKAYSGLQLGSAAFDFKGRKWTMAPGAIAENLTSLGGDFTNGSQSKLTDLLHAGAVMSSGAVTEPYSIQYKFPHPMLFYYYASGASAIEAFYSSVTSPYQLLIVGDPMCTPFAVPPPEVVMMSLNESAGRMLVCERKELPGMVRKFPTRHIEVFYRSRLVQVIEPRIEDGTLTRRIRINLPAQYDGILEIKVVSVGKDAVESRAEFTEQFRFGSDEKFPTAERLKSAGASVETVKLGCAGADSIELLQYGKAIATVQGESGEVTLFRADIGDGPVMVRPSAMFGETRVNGVAIELDSIR